MWVLAQQNGFGSSTIASGFVVAGERHTNIVHMREKSVINMIWLLFIAADWPIMLIGPGGLLLVIPYLFALPLSVFMGGVENRKKETKTWMWKLFLQGQILSTTGNALTLD